MLRSIGGGGAPAYVKPPTSVPRGTSPSAFGGLTTVTSELPGMFAGVVAVIVNASRTLTPVASYTPKRTAAPKEKLLPERRTPVPPVTGPEEGATAVRRGFRRM